MEVKFDRNRFATFEGVESGRVSTITVGVHGNETPGPNALGLVLPELRLDAGRVYFGYGNPRALRKGVRSVGPNLNRMFLSDEELSEEERGSYEYGRAQKMKRYLDKSEVLLDIHGTKNPVSSPFVICEPNGYEIVSQLPYDLVASGFDEFEPGGTDYYMNMQGKIGICAEAGYNLAPDSVDRARDTMFAFLRARGHLEGETIRRIQRHVAIYSMYRTKTPDFSLEKILDNFAEVPAGQVIGYDGGIEVAAEKPSLVLFADTLRHEKVDSEAFLLCQDQPAIAL